MHLLGNKTYPLTFERLEGWVKVAERDCVAQKIMATGIECPLLPHQRYPSTSREILRDGRFGRLVPIRDAGAFAVAMADSLAATHNTEALRARTQDFSIDKATDRYLKLFFPQTFSGECT